MKNLKKISYLSVCAFLLTLGFLSTGAAQDRQRVVKTISSRPINQPPAPAQQTPADSTRSTSSPAPLISRSTSRPVLTNKIEIAEKKPVDLVAKTGSSSPVNTMAAAVARAAYNPGIAAGLMKGIESRLGIRYLYGASGPNRYDCSGFVWAVFKDAGIEFERTSARTLWEDSEPVTGDDRFKFGTLVFFNHLGHVGIVADENGFYQASSSKGITYSKFAGYWEKRIVGFRRIVANK